MLLNNVVGIWVGIWDVKPDLYLGFLWSVLFSISADGKTVKPKMACPGSACHGHINFVIDG